MGDLIYGLTLGDPLVYAPVADKADFALTAGWNQPRAVARLQLEGQVARMPPTVPVAKAVGQSSPAAGTPVFLTVPASTRVARPAWGTKGALVLSADLLRARR